jgi:hypothetical protein
MGTNSLINNFFKWYDFSKHMGARSDGNASFTGNLDMGCVDQNNEKVLVAWHIHIPIVEIVA